jgi:hypothetical protein
LGGRPGAAPGRVGRALLLAVLVLSLAACELRTELNVTVEEDGSGVLEIGLGLDEEGVAEQPELLEDLEFEDLVDAGWRVSEPTEEADGFTWVRVRRRFDHPDELAPLVEQVAAEDGPFRDFRLERDPGFASTEYRFHGIVDFSRGVASVTDDPELSEALGAEPLELIEDRLGRAVDELIGVQVAVRLPGEVSSNAPTRASNGAVWRPSVLEPEAVELTATSSITRTERLLWLGVAVVAGFALALLLAVRFAAWRRSRSSARSS